MRSVHVFKSGGCSGTTIAVRRIRLADLASALRAGLRDLEAGFSHYIFAVLICPVTGVCLFALAARMNAWHLIYPILAGFALVGPFVALGLYEFSRRRELGLETSPRQIAGVLRSPALPAIAALGLWLMFLFLAWLYLAQALYSSVFPDGAFEDPASFLSAVFTTRRGWSLLLLGNLAQVPRMSANQQTICRFSQIFQVLMTKKKKKQGSLKLAVEKPKQHGCWNPEVLYTAVFKTRVKFHFMQRLKTFATFLNAKLRYDMHVLVCGYTCLT